MGGEIYLRKGTIFSSFAAAKAAAAAGYNPNGARGGGMLLLSR
jgi:hypothetical protein